MFGEAFRAIAALQQESVTGRDLCQRFLEAARFPGKDQRRKRRQLRFDIGERFSVGIIRHLHGRLRPPRIRAPPRRIQPHRHNYPLGICAVAAANRPKKPSGREPVAFSICRLKAQCPWPASLYTGMRGGDSLSYRQFLNYSAATRAKLAKRLRIVTSSSAAVGCSAMVASKSAFFAPIFTAIAAIWAISAAPSPTTWQPTTRSDRPSTTSFISTLVLRPESVAFSGLNMAL